MNELLVYSNISIKNALKQMGKGGEKCLIVIDDQEIFLGTLSDGDLRNAILAGEQMSASIENIYNSNATFFRENQFSDEEIKSVFIKNKFDIVPLISSNNKVAHIFKWSEVFDENVDKKYESIDLPVVIMAGGIGSRLDPFTKVLPKPLVPVSGKPIIDHIIESFNMIGCSEFYLTTNYKKNILKAYFEDTQRSYKVNFVDENSPLGTAGSLKLLQGKFKNPFFVSNCDIIVKINYKSFYDFHIQGKYDITLVASTKEYIIPYGTCELNKNGYLSKINEKPKYNFLVNAGLYIINPETIKNIPNNKFYHITHLIESLIKKNKRVGVFPVDEDEWIDVGEWAEYKKAIKRL